ncbi:MAG: hypothetical protein HC796_03580 [Synechococcaceae cyanobacterium RL_1_2]|nr:hypothetical protein [Synechococcaceae cyanobacterium RL_1_2]
MNTPAHVIINLLCLGREENQGIIPSVVVGAILPDAPMFVFYLIEKIIKQTPEDIIWQEAYYDRGWQNFIDLFNSLPLILLALTWSLYLGSKVGTLLCLSMVLHLLGDLPLHHEDAHRHFFPFSDWRFISPISYWDPRYHGLMVAKLEILSVIASSILLALGYDHWWSKGLLALIAIAYGSYFIYAWWMWG